MSAAPITRVQVDMPVPPGTWRHGLDGEPFEVSLVVWMASRLGVSVFVHGDTEGAVDQVARDDLDGFPHPGLWFDEIAKQVAR